MDIHSLTTADFARVSSDIEATEGAEAATLFYTEFSAGIDRIRDCADEWKLAIRHITEDRALQLKLLRRIGSGGDIRTLGIAWSNHAAIEALQERVNLVRRGE